jgi:hypothetical protein
MTIDFTRLINKINPEPDGTPTVALRTMVVATVNGDGTVNLTSSGVTIPNVARLASSSVSVGNRVQVLSARGVLLVLGPVA